MKINNFELCNLAAYFPKQKILAIADLHIGIEEALFKQGIFVPKETNNMLSALDKLLKEKKPKKVIVCGDFKHEFGEISKTEWKDSFKFIDTITKYSELILVKGNHDTILEPIAKKKNVRIIDFYCEDNILFFHGDKEESKVNGLSAAIKDANLLVIGHNHPAIILEKDSRKEKYKCFLQGKYKIQNKSLPKLKNSKKEILVIPPFNPLSEGINVLKEVISPYLNDIDNFEVFVCEDKIYEFGKVKTLKKKFKEN